MATDGAAAVEILRAGKDDLREILDLQRLAYQSEGMLVGNPNIQPLRQTLEEAEKEFDGGVFLKAVDGLGAIVGSVRARSQNGTVYVGKLMTRPDAQGQGIASALIGELERVLPGRRYELFTSAKSAKNIRLYGKLGYSAIGERTGDDGLTLVFFEKLA